MVLIQEGRAQGNLLQNLPWQLKNTRVPEITPHNHRHGSKGGNMQFRPKINPLPALDHKWQ